MNLIPFAYLVSTKELVDVADVPSGSACKCICPSCEIPLIAKKGGVKEWHFAHDSKYIDKEQTEQCDFSWVVAVKMMCKQLLMEGQELQLPDYFVEMSGIGYKSQMTKVQVTTSSRICYKSPEIKRLGCDVVLDVGGKRLGILFTRKQKEINDYYKFESSLVGVLGIDVNAFAYDAEGKPINHLRSYLKMSLTENDRAKFWLYHARRKSVVEKEEERQRTLRNINLSRASQETRGLVNPQEIPKTTATWRCISCNHTYSGSSVGLNPCPKCDSHFYRRQME